MEHRTIKNLLIIAGFIGFMVFSSCYNDNSATLYPAGACDTTNITFTANVLPIINANCTGCHSGSTPAGNISLTNYSDVVASLNSGRLMGSIRHESGYSPMPKGGNKLSNCELAKIEIWVKDGFPNN
jgi:hypothetical protein